MAADLAPSDLDIRPVNFESNANNTIILHESPVSTDINNLFILTNPGPMNSPVYHLLLGNQVPVSRARFSIEYLLNRGY